MISVSWLKPMKICKRRTWRIRKKEQQKKERKIIHTSNGAETAKDSWIIRKNLCSLTLSMLTSHIDNNLIWHYVCFFVVLLSDASRDDILPSSFWQLDKKVLIWKKKGETKNLEGMLWGMTVYYVTLRHFKGSLFCWIWD